MYPGVLELELPTILTKLDIVVGNEEFEDHDTCYQDLSIISHDQKSCFFKIYNLFLPHSLYASTVYSGTLSAANGLVFSQIFVIILFIAGEVLNQF